MKGAPSRANRPNRSRFGTPAERAALVAELVAHRNEKGYGVGVANRLGCTIEALAKWLRMAGESSGVLFRGAAAVFGSRRPVLPKAPGPSELRGRCGITGEECRWWLDCQWSAAERVRCQSDSVQKNGFARIEACAVAIRDQLSSCTACRERRRCAEAWRCFRAELKEREARR